MNKENLVNEIAEKADFTKKDVATMVEVFLEVVTDTLAEGEDVQFLGFGAFKVSKRKAREGRNPSTGETIQIAASKVVRFVPGKRLKERVKN